MTKPVKLSPEMKKRLSRIRREREAREKYYREYRFKMEAARSAIYGSPIK
jgi:hypothetical protein